ncbi:MAG: glycosyltransferase involved in cell wall biosynthesis [Halioglobus sp.]|jgi:glycosyltransferase involved in cell wall biosynthesis
MTDNKNSSGVKVAMACPGVGLVQRGFERMFQDLFDLLEDDIDVTLFKGGGKESKKERRLLFTTRNGRFLKWFPIHKLLGRTEYHVECLTFAISLLLAMRGQGFQIVHCADPPLTRILYKLRRMFKLNFRILYCEGCAMPASDYPPSDHIQQISQVTHNEAIDYNIPAEFMTVIPLGINPDFFSVTNSRKDLREKYDISESTFVVVCVAAINRYHKRTDYLIDEFSKLEGDILLWVDGSMDQGDLDLLTYAQEKLGDRCRITHLPSKCVGELFTLADLMVHAATYEAFGLALIEGASTGLPLLTHNAPHFLWLMNNEPAALDMNVEGNLANRVRELVDHPEKLVALSNGEEISRKYNWLELKQDYLAMYAKIASLPESEIGIAEQYGLQ